MGNWVDRHAIQVLTTFVVVTLGAAAAITAKMAHDLRKTAKK